MKVEQLTIRLERNEPGNLAMVAATLAEEGMNILSLSLSGPETGIGILRVIVNDAPRAGAALREKGFTTSIDHVVVVATPDKPGALADALDFIAREGFNIEYLYAFSHRSGEAGINIFCFDQTDEAITALNRGGFKVLTIEELLAL